MLCLADGLEIEEAARAVRVGEPEARLALQGAVTRLAGGSRGGGAAAGTWFEETIVVEARGS